MLIEVIDFAGKRLTFNTFEEMLENINNIKELVIYEYEMGNEYLQQLANALQNNKTIQKLEIQYCRIFYQGAEIIANALKINNTIEELNLMGNKIGDYGAAYIADALKVNKTLSKVSLFRNYIGPEGANSLAEAIISNYTLDCLLLHDNAIEGDGLRAFENAIQNNNTLSYLVIGKKSEVINSKLKFNRYHKENIIADELIACTTNQGILHLFLERNQRDMYNYLINIKNQTPEQANEIIETAKKRYDPFKAFFADVAKHAYSHSLPYDVLRKIAKFALPKGNFSYTKAIEKAHMAKQFRANLELEKQQRREHMHIASPCIIL